MSILREPEKPVRKDDKFSGLCLRNAQLFTPGEREGESAPCHSHSKREERKKESFVSVSPLRAEHLTWMESTLLLTRSGVQQWTWP